MASNLFKIAFAVLVIGWAPILLYTIFGPGGDNPIGLGVLAWGSIIMSLMMAAISGTIFLLRSWRESRRVSRAT